MFAFLDRSNVGNAETAGMGTDLGFNDSQYQVCSPAYCDQGEENG